jgi:hypothetical protein
MKVPEGSRHRHLLLIAFAVVLVLSGTFVMYAAAELSEKTTVTYLQPEGKTLIQNSGTWIILDPVSDQITGDDVILTAMTNLPAGTMIEIWITEPDGLTYDSMGIWEYYSGGGLPTVKNGSTQGNNLILTRMDTLHMRSAEYKITYINSGNMTGYIPDPLLLFPNTSRSNITNFTSGSEDSADSYWLSIDPFSLEENNSSIYTITGTTNLPEGEKLSCSVFYYVEPQGATLPKGIKDFPENLSHCTGHVVYGGSGMPNRFTLQINSSGLPNGTNWVTIWNPRYNSSNPDTFLSRSINFREGFAAVESNSTTSYEENGTILIQNGSTWIRTEMSIDQTAGEMFNITGTTNLQPGDYLLGILESGGSLFMVDTVTVQNGTTPGENNFLFLFDTEDCPPGEYVIHLVSPKIEGLMNSFTLFENTSGKNVIVLNATDTSPRGERILNALINSLYDTFRHFFQVNGTAPEPETYDLDKGYCLFIEPPSAKDNNSQNYVITGYTNLSAGKNLYCDIYTGDDRGNISSFLDLLFPVTIVVSLLSTGFHL